MGDSQEGSSDKRIRQPQIRSSPPPQSSPAANRARDRRDTGMQSYEGSPRIRNASPIPARKSLKADAGYIPPGRGASATIAMSGKTSSLIFSTLFVVDALLLFALAVIIVVGKEGFLQSAGDGIVSVAWQLRLFIAILLVCLSIALRAWSLTQFLQQQREDESTFEKGEIVNVGQERPSLQSPPAPDSVTSSEEDTRAAVTAPVPSTVASVPKRSTIYDSTREPDDPSDLEEHPHTRLFPIGEEQNALPNGWRVIGASRRGYGHAYEGKYREDDFNIRLSAPTTHSHDQESDIALIAIADGIGSKQYSRRGARAAVLGATDVEEAHLQELAVVLAEGDPRYEALARTLLMQALQTASAQVKSRAQHDTLDVRELHSTLMVYLVAPYRRRQVFVASVQVGDGALFAFQPKGDENVAPHELWTCLQQPQIQIAGNEVQPFMRSTPDVWEHYMRCDVLDNVTFIMGMTDGTADDIEPPRATANTPHPDPFVLVHDFYLHLQGARTAEQVHEFLGYKKRGSFDDRTVVCLYQER